MSKTTELTQRIQQKQQADLDEIQKLQSEHAARMKQLYKDALNDIERDTESLASLAKTKIKRSVTLLVPIYSLALIGVLICVAAIWYGNHLSTLIAQRRQTLHNVPNLHVTTCGKSHRTCVKVKPNIKGYGKNGQWRIIPQ